MFVHVVLLESNNLYIYINGRHVVLKSLNVRNDCQSKLSCLRKINLFLKNN